MLFLIIFILLVGLGLWGLAIRRSTANLSFAWLIPLAGVLWSRYESDLLGHINTFFLQFLIAISFV